MKFDSNGWLDEAIEIDYLNKSMDRQGHKISHIVMHATAGGSSAENIANYFATSADEASAHFIIGQDGHIVQGIPLSVAAWANGIFGSGHVAYLPSDSNPNFYTVSIEHVKPSTDNSDALTPIQAQKSFELVKCLCDTCSIPKRAGDAQGGIISHAAINPVDRANCPGAYPWDDLWKYLEEEEVTIDLTTPGVSRYFAQAPGGAWKCITKGHPYVIGGAILKFYRQFSKDLCGLTWLGLPTSDEIGNPLVKSVVIQHFERGTLRYDPLYTQDRPPGITGSVYVAKLEEQDRQTSPIPVVAKPVMPPLVPSKPVPPPSINAG